MPNLATQHLPSLTPPNRPGVITRNIGEAMCFCSPLIITAAQINDMFGCIGQALDHVAKTGE
jgi:adenosylmethionine-8-amino-7-oxononanoate aminotransferase